MTKIINGQAAPLISSAKVSGKRLNLKYFNLFLFSIIAGLGVFYLININDLTVQGFALQNLKSQSTDLASTNLDIQERVNLAQSYSSLSARVQGLNLVSVSNVEYLSPNDVAVAQK